MSKKNKHRIIRFSWYHLILIFSIIISIILLVFSYNYFICEPSNPWLSNLFTSLATSLVFGAILSFVFAYINERNNLISDIKREITEILRNLFLISGYMSNSATRINSTIDLLEMLPDLYEIDKIYPKYSKEYSEFKSKLKDNNKFNNDSIVVDIIEIIDKTLKIQELFYQEYLGSKKKPIPGQVAFVINDPIDDYGTIYSSRKRKFKKRVKDLSSK